MLMRSNSIGQNLMAVMGMVVASLPLSAAQPSDTSALINKQLDSVQNLNLDTTLPEALQQITTQTGVRFQVDPAIRELLPWGDQTTIKASIENHTLRQGLTAITQRLGLEFVLGDEAVQLKPMPALGRLGHRATVDELGVLALMNTTPLSVDHPNFRQLTTAVNEKLAALKSTFAIENRTSEALQDQKISVAGNPSMADLLEDMSEQTTATWYPSGKTIFIVSKETQIRSQLNKTITARYSGVEVGQVLLELFQRAGVDFTVDPGAYEKIPAQARSIQLLLDNATIEQALESISGYTGLAFEVTGKGVHVSYQVNAATTKPVIK